MPAKRHLVYRHATKTRETIISNNQNTVKHPSWQEVDQLARPCSLPAKVIK